jgi:hypothetical protein
MAPLRPDELVDDDHERRRRLGCALGAIECAVRVAEVKQESAGSNQQ